MQIYIVRHGVTDANKDGQLQGWMDTDLNDLGVRLARYTGEGLKNVRFDAAFTSPLHRAQETARIILEESGNELPLLTDDRLKEIHVGIWQGKRYKNGFSEVPSEQMDLFIHHPEQFPGFTGGETLEQLCVRTQAFLTELSTKPYQTVLVVTHGTALRAMLYGIYGNQSMADFWHGGASKNCAVNIVEAEDGRLRLTQEDRIYYPPEVLDDRIGIGY